MRLLFLLLIIACGKHETPVKKDLGDLDGDRIFNYKESGLSKYISKVDHLPRIKGTLSFISDPLRNIEEEIEITNECDLKSDVMVLLTKRLNLLKTTDYFSEWLKLRPKISKNNINLNRLFFEISLRFELPEIRPTAIYITKGKEFRKVADWNEKVNFILSKEDLALILEGKAYLSLSSDWLERPYSSNTAQGEQIKQNTYRVFYFNGEEGQVLYVSRNLSFKKLQGSLEAQDVIQISELDFFNVSKEARYQQWWARHINENDKILAKLRPNELSEAYFNSYSKNEIKIARLNGQGQSAKLIKPKASIVHLLIRGEKTVREFSEFQEKKVFRRTSGGGPMNGDIHEWECISFNRTIKSETKLKLSLNDLINQLQIKVNGISAFDNATIRQGDDEFGPYWTLSLGLEGESIEIKLLNKGASSFVQTGIYREHCDGGKGSGTRITNTNTEGHFKLKLEAFVEKMD